MADHRISFTEYPTTGAIRNLIVDGAHWVSVGSAHSQASGAAQRARQELLLDLKEQVEGMPDALTGAPGRATVLDIEDVLDAINNRLKEF
jgi:methylthioribose-1-phosphate isomerase